MAHKWKCPGCDTWQTETIGRACSSCAPRKHTDEELEAIDGRLELADEQQPGALLCEPPQPVPQVGPAVNKRLPARTDARDAPVRSVRTSSGKATVYKWIDGQEPIPNLGGNALKLVGAFQQLQRATLKEIATHLAGQLQVDHPEKFIGAYASRLKKAGLIEVEAA